MLPASTVQSTTTHDVYRTDEDSDSANAVDNYDPQDEDCICEYEHTTPQSRFLHIPFLNR